MLTDPTPINQLSIDVAVLREQVSAMKDTLDRIDTILTQNGLVEKVITNQARIESLESMKAWAFWVLGSLIVGVILSLVGFRLK